MKLTTILILASLLSLSLSACVQDEIMKGGKGGKKITFLDAPVDDTRTEGFCNAEWKTNKTCCKVEDSFRDFAKE